MLYYNDTYAYKCFHATYHVGDEGKSSMGTLLGADGPFNPDTDDWVVYSERLEQFFKANGVSDLEKQRAVLLSVCGNETYVLISPKERGGGKIPGPGPLEPRPLLVTRHAPSGLVDNEWLSW